MDWRVHPQVEAFVAAGRAFESLIGSAEAKARTTWLSALLSSALTLYAAGLALPDVTIAEADVDTLETFAVSREEWEACYQPWERIDGMRPPLRVLVTPLRPARWLSVISLMISPTSIGISCQGYGVGTPTVESVLPRWCGSGGSAS